MARDVCRSNYYALRYVMEPSISYSVLSLILNFLSDVQKYVSQSTNQFLKFFPYFVLLPFFSKQIEIS